MDDDYYVLEVKEGCRNGRGKYSASQHIGYANDLNKAGKFFKAEAEAHAFWHPDKYEAKHFKDARIAELEAKLDSVVECGEVILYALRFRQGKSMYESDTIEKALAAIEALKQPASEGM